MIQPHRNAVAKINITISIDEDWDFLDGRCWWFPWKAPLCFELGRSVLGNGKFTIGESEYLCFTKKRRVLKHRWPLAQELDRAYSTKSTQYRRRCLNLMRYLNRSYGVLPPSMYLKDLVCESTTAVNGGGFAVRGWIWFVYGLRWFVYVIQDIWIGRWENQCVCVKVLRFFQRGSDRDKLLKVRWYIIRMRSEYSIDCSFRIWVRRCSYGDSSSIRTYSPSLVSTLTYFHQVSVSSRLGCRTAMSCPIPVVYHWISVPDWNMSFSFPSIIP